MAAHLLETAVVEALLADEYGFHRRLPVVVDTLSTFSPYERVVLMKGAQTGGSEAGLNWLGYIIQNAPGIAMLVMPAATTPRCGSPPPRRSPPPWHDGPPPTPISPGWKTSGAMPPPSPADLSHPIKHADVAQHDVYELDSHGEGDVRLEEDGPSLDF